MPVVDGVLPVSKHWMRIVAMESDMNVGKIMLTIANQA
jgi:hypothetical protein